MPRRQPNENQLGLDIPALAARSARAELADHAGKSGSRKRALGGRYGSWPGLGEPLVLLLPIHGPEGPLEAELLGEFMGVDFDPALGCNLGRVRLAAQQPGLSPSLAASLPKTVHDIHLNQLRKRVDVEQSLHIESGGGSET